jgi:imidazole glycerol-phosphate synthase subunit HisF
MVSHRVIPVLLLSNKGLVKTKQFKNPTYVGDPINAIRIFNEKEVDELVFHDINASKQGRKPDFKLIESIASECFMPLGYGGGISELDDISKLFKIGVEKVILNSIVFIKPEIITKAAKIAGNQSVVVSIDIKKNWLGKRKVYSHVSKKLMDENPIDFALRMQRIGAGELIINSVDNDGMMNGYDLELIDQLSSKLEIPVVACGGAGNFEHLKKAILQGGASAVAAGSLFVFHGPLKGVLINYPNQKQLIDIFK